MKVTTMRTKNMAIKWHIIDAKGQVLGRLAATVAHHLRGKHKPAYAHHLDCGDHVIVINAAEVKVTANKSRDKQYYRHSAYPGGLRTDSFEKLQQRAPGRVVEIAVKGMLPRGPLGYKALTKLRVYAGAEHSHQAQQPQALQVPGADAEKGD